jgi:integrase/recombinase XerD
MQTPLPIPSNEQAPQSQPATPAPGPQEPSALDVLSTRYLKHLELINYSPRTLATQVVYFHRFGEFLTERKISDVRTVTSATLQDFQHWLFYQPTIRGTARTVASQNRVLSAIKSFFAFLVAEGYMAHNPAQGFKLAKEPDALPKNVLTPEEARRFIEAPDTQTLSGYRDRTLLEVLYSTGIRKSELRNLTVDDVNLEEELLRVNRGKGAKDRVVPLSSVACQFLENYLKAIRPEMLKGRQTDKLFLSIRDGRPIGEHGVKAILNYYVRKLRLKKHVTCHLWRHTCATHLVKNNANLRCVQEMLGHKSLATTERYLRLTITDLKEAHHKFHPREQQQRRRAVQG